MVEGASRVPPSMDNSGSEEEEAAAEEEEEVEEELDAPAAEPLPAAEAAAPPLPVAAFGPAHVPALRAEGCMKKKITFLFPAFPSSACCSVWRGCRGAQRAMNT